MGNPYRQQGEVRAAWRAGGYAADATSEADDDEGVFSGGGEGGRGRSDGSLPQDRRRLREIAAMRKARLRGDKQVRVIYGRGCVLLLFWPHSLDPRVLCPKELAPPPPCMCRHGPLLVRYPPTVLDMPAARAASGSLRPLRRVARDAWRVTRGA